MNLIFEPKQIIADWLGHKLKTKFHEPFTVIGIQDRFGGLKGAALFNDFTGPNVEITVAGEGCWMKGVLRAIADYAFGQLGCCRATVTIRADAPETVNLAERVGFIREGHMRRFYGDCDGIVLGMVASECRWLGKGL